MRTTCYAGAGMPLYYSFKLTNWTSLQYLNATHSNTCQVRGLVDRHVKIQSLQVTVTVSNKNAVCCSRLTFQHSQFQSISNFSSSANSLPARPGPGIKFLRSVKSQASCDSYECHLHETMTMLHVTSTPANLSLIPLLNPLSAVVSDGYI